MSAPFDVNRYWLKRGQTYSSEERMKDPFFKLQEEVLLRVLRGSDLPLGNVLELGCGYGRVTKLLAENFPQSRITALDLSPDQLASARSYCAGLGQIDFGEYDFYSGKPLPGSGYDCALAIEVFLHHPADVVLGLIGKLAGVSRHILNLDWSEPWNWATPEHVWVHDYAMLYEQAGLHTVIFPLPQKYEGKQQKIFVAGKELPERLVRLANDFRPQAEGSESGAIPESPFDPAGWLQHLELAREEIASHIPPGSAFILVNDDQWGEAEQLPGRHSIPFLEREGKYWGPPGDDATAIRELQRLHESGADYIVFAWSAFWWLEHYPAFSAHLKWFDQILSNERLVIFRLKDAPSLKL